MGQLSNSDQHRKHVEEALHVSEHDLRLVIDSFPGFVWTDTAAGEIEFVNRPYLNYLGKTLEEVKDWAERPLKRGLGRGATSTSRQFSPLKPAPKATAKS